MSSWIEENKVAVGVGLVAAIAAVLYFNNNKKKQQQTITSSTTKMSGLEPGTKKPCLTQDSKQTLLTDQIVLDALKKDDLVDALTNLIQAYSCEAVKEWRLDNKHKNALVHELTRRKQGEALSFLVKQHRFDLNVPRASDQCTPLHLSAWTKQPKLMKLLLDLGADSAAINKYGEDCSKLVAITEKMDNLCFLDLELTHLPADGPSCQNSILECAVIITSKDLEVLTQQNWVVHHPDETLAGLSEWHQKEFCSETDGGNGLFEAVKASETSKGDMETQLLALLQEHCVEGLCRLAGNSVHCDREVLFQAMPKIYRFCSHQVVDVSTISTLVKMWKPQLAATIPPASTYNHRAENDIASSLSMLKWFKDNAFVPDL